MKDEEKEVTLTLHREVVKALEKLASLTGEPLEEYAARALLAITAKEVRTRAARRRAERIRRNCPPLRYLHRYESASFQGWRLSLTRGGCIFCRYFSLLQYGSEKAAYSAAVEVRARLLELLEQYRHNPQAAFSLCRASGK